MMLDQPMFRLSDSCDASEIGELFWRAQKEETKRHQSLYKGSYKSLLEENLGLLDEQTWAEMCIFYGWKDITQYQERRL